MAEKLVMLALSPTMEQGTIAKWLKKEGDPITSGDILCEVETDKASMEYETTSEGTLLKIVVPEGGRAKVGKTIAIAGEAGEDVSGMVGDVDGNGDGDGDGEGDGNGDAERKPESGQPKPDARNLHSAITNLKSGTGVPASPLARRLASERGIDIRMIHGSGPGGRVVKGDVETFVPSVRGAPVAVGAGVAAPQNSEIPLSEKRRVIAQRLAASKYTSPHYYLRNHVAMDRLLAARADLNAKRDPRLGLNAFLIKLAAQALVRHPLANASWGDDAITAFGTVDIALAVSQKDGLITPVVRNCAAKGIEQIDAELKDLVSRARDGALTPEDYTGATFTISNLGSFGVREFTAIINPPASAILAVGDIFKEPVVDEHDQVTVQQTSVFTLSCDHRVLDGAVAAAFLSDLTKMVEQPIRALV